MHIYIYIFVFVNLHIYTHMYIYITYIYIVLALTTMHAVIYSHTRMGKQNTLVLALYYYSWCLEVCFACAVYLSVYL